MKIPGTNIAEIIKSKLIEQCTQIKSKGITPTLAVVLIGEDAPSHVYVARKEKIGAEIGVDVRVHKMPSGVIKSTLLQHIEMLNQDPHIHGIIIQRPTPVDINRSQLDLSVQKEKDVDGFHPESPYTPPIASAILEILHWVYAGIQQTPYIPFADSPQLLTWLTKKSILVIGRGETGGMPILNTLQKLGMNPVSADSKTENITDLSLQADIIISCVGRSNIVRHQMVTNKTILLGVGMHSENEKMRADYDSEEIADKVLYYTSVPGGVGPVNVVCLMKNVISSAKSTV